MFSQQQLQQQQLQQQQLQQQQQLLQLQQLFQQPPLQAPLPVTIGRGLPPQPPQQQFLNVPASVPLLNSSAMQRALFLQQLQGLDQFAVPPAVYEGASLTVPTATLGNVRSYSLAAPNMPAPSLTPPQLATPSLQQFFPQATRQSLLGPPPVGVPVAPSQVQHSGRSHQKQARPPSATNPTRKDSSSQTMPMDGPLEGSEEGGEPQPEAPDPDSWPGPGGIAQEKDVPAAEPESPEGESVGPPAKRTKSSKEPTAKGPPGQLKAKVQPQARMAVPKQTQTAELLPEPPEARVLPRFQPRALHSHAQVPPSEATVPALLLQQAHTQTSPELALGPQQARREEAEPEMLPQAPPQVHAPAQTQVCPRVQGSAPPAEPPREQIQAPAAEGAPAPGHCAVPDRPPGSGGAAGGPDEPPGPQLGTSETAQELPGGLDVKEGERRSRETLGMWGAGGSLKVTIQQSSNSRAFSTAPVPPVPRSGDAAAPHPTQALYFCCLCKANCSAQQEFQEHLAGAEHQQRLGDVQQRSQACLLSLLPVPRDVLERDQEEPPSQRWCHTCQLYYMGDLIQHRRTQEHKIAKQSLRPFCTACDRYFKTPRKFVEHVKSQEHKDRAKELNMPQETAGQEEEHFIIVDAVGCFEGDEEEEEEEEEEDIEVEEEFCKQMRTPDASTAELKDSDTYSPDKAYGVDFLVPATGHVCRICRKFYPGDAGARLNHCKSLAHFENLQKYKKAKKPKPAPRPVSRRCAINARNALSALFTAGGRSPTQPSSQELAKASSKMAAPQPLPPAPRRSTRLKT